MRVKFSILLLVAAIAAFTAVSAISQNGSLSSDENQASVSEELFQKYRQGDLSRDEFDEFLKLALSASARSYKEESAGRYLESQGFQEVSLHGVRKMNLKGRSEPQEYQLASCWPKVYALDLTFTEPLPPGIYWGKLQGFSLDVLDRDGKIRSYGVQNKR